MGRARRLVYRAGYWWPRSYKCAAVSGSVAEPLKSRPSDVGARRLNYEKVSNL